jgi:hypothetical protein
MRVTCKHAAPLSAGIANPSNTFVSTFDTGERPFYKRLVQKDDEERSERAIVGRTRRVDALTMAVNQIGRQALTCILVDGDSAILESVTGE